ncbi:LacI family DNA-binding transcriptional regulator [Occultella kanbiaonis]|uniref:LacI family DNA-binding transcriptional regulator n=1 Tax=Occultella kanbiaonis TaxID=2675754 RepID=UPI0012BA145F|nr:LacI family DNA-binding transcriptional regulator [Occultella kanbiaonis]
MTARVRLKDVADSLGLSVNTVSRALAGKSEVSPVTRQRIQDEADRLGYVPNTLARSLVLGSNQTLALVITNPSNPLYAELISGVEVRARQHGYSLLLLVTEESTENERAAVEALLRSAVDGAIAVPVQSEHEHWRRVNRAGIPLVLVNRDIPELDTDFVGVDNRRGAYDATRHVIARGARTVWALEEDLPITTIAERIDGFHKALDEGGLPSAARDVVAVPTRRYESSALPWQAEGAYTLCRELIAERGAPDAVITGNDYFALGLMRALTELGHRVPDDVLVTGYGDHPYAGFVSPSLSSVRLPGSQIGAAAVDLLLARGEEPTDQPVKRRIAPTFVARDSTARGETTPDATATA